MCCCWGVKRSAGTTEKDANESHCGLRERNLEAENNTREESNEAATTTAATYRVAHYRRCKAERQHQPNCILHIGDVKRLYDLRGEGVYLLMGIYWRWEKMPTLKAMPEGVEQWQQANEDFYWFGGRVWNGFIESC
ncbi:hypothetical protein PV326_001874 [Microctonus aethiopoides]|nr:hypothetical protein PV326_001874 [Microctonus aethiopoides]